MIVGYLLAYGSLNNLFFILQHFYPDGGWGWIVCGVAFLAHVLTTGFQLSYGILLLYCMRHLNHHADTEAGKVY